MQRLADHLLYLQSFGEKLAGSLGQLLSSLHTLGATWLGQPRQKRVSVNVSLQGRLHLQGMESFYCVLDSGLGCVSDACALCLLGI